MISSSGGRSRSFYRSSRGLLIAHPPRPETEPQGITTLLVSGIPNRKKTDLVTRLSCKTEYIIDSDQLETSNPSSFFTDD